MSDKKERDVSEDFEVISEAHELEDDDLEEVSGGGCSNGGGCVTGDCDGEVLSS